ncbi:MAG: HEAT repeat domain-containing protein [Planctomycetota bacterium]|jgi:tetratricopeptide (TPR) repeat protein
MRRHTTLPVLAVAITFLLVSTAAADIVILKNGGRIEGEVIDQGDSVLVRIKDGMTTTIQRKDIKEIIIKKSPLQIYEEKSFALADDDLLGHYALGLWCLDQGLNKEAEIELEKVIALDPEHEGARKQLGHEKADGKWLTKEEVMTQKGFVKYRGKWMKKEEAEALQKKEELEDNIDEWTKAIERAKDEPPAEILEKLSKISDPAVLDALIKELRSRSEHVRAAVAQSLGLIGDPKPGKKLLKLVIDDKHEKVRAASAVAINGICRKTHNYDLLNKIIETMFKQGYPKDRRAAAEALGNIGDRGFVSYLIKALVIKVKVRDKSGDEFDPFGTGGSTSGVGRSKVGPKGVRVGGHAGGSSQGGFSAGPVDEKHKIVEKQNPKALEALKKITGQDFGYDKDAWQEWYLKDLEKRAEEEEKDSDSGK